MGTSTTSAPVRTDRLNRLAVAAFVMALLATTGFLLLGMSILAVFAVGAGHVSLNQFQRSGDRGRGLAVAALCISYAMGCFALFHALASIPSMIQQLFG